MFGSNAFVDSMDAHVLGISQVDTPNSEAACNYRGTLGAAKDVELAVASGTHPRLGKESNLQSLTPALVKREMRQEIRIRKGVDEFLSAVRKKDKPAVSQHITLTLALTNCSARWSVKESR